jgi:nuclear migration protein JNM1
VLNCERGQDAAPEVYETPDLADDVSTVPTGTVRTISPSPSSDDDALPGLDRQPLDRDGARRRFETSKVDARGVDFSDSIGGTRRAYRTRSSARRKRRIRDDGGTEAGDLSDSDDETLAMKLARLKREAEEVKMELERREKEKDDEAEFKDSVEQQQQRKDEEDDDTVLDGVQELSRILDGLSTKARLKTNGSIEDEFVSRLTTASRTRQPQQDERGPSTESSANPVPAQQSTLSAVADFSDRLTALESALGVSSTTATSQSTAILPTLASLANQITTLSATLAPAQNSSNTATPNTAYLDSVSAKLKLLIAESDRLTQSRKAALASLTDLHEKRMTQLVSNASVHANSRSSRLRGLSAASSSANHQHTDLKADGTGGPGEESLQIQSQLFLDEQASKITALYHLLPTIQDLQPLLPVVLERLRTLSILHNGAAQAKGLVDDLESRQRELKEEMAKWRSAVENLERGMTEAEEVMKSNVEIIGRRVSEVEQRVGQLGRS